MFFLFVLFISYSYSTAGTQVGDYFPNFEADSTDGNIKFYDWKGESWAILLFSPKDYTPVATTELARAMKLEPELKKRRVKVIALSFDSLEDHKGWAKDIIALSGISEATTFPFPIITDPKMELAKKLQIMHHDETVELINRKAVFIIGPTGKLRISMWYPVTTGIRFNEILRVVDSMQLTDTDKVFTPVDWTEGDRCIVSTSLDTEESRNLFQEGAELQPLPSGRPYLNWTPNPQKADDTGKHSGNPQ